EDFLPDEVAQRRLEQLIDLHRRIQLEINQAEVGRTVEVLVEREARRGGLQGRTEGNKVVTFDGAATLIGSFVSVRLTSTTGATFTGQLQPEAEQRVA